MTLRLHGTTEDFLSRIARLEQFKEAEVNGSVAWKLKRSVSREKLITIKNYLYEDENLTRTKTDDKGFIINYGPDEEGDYFTLAQAGELNMAVAIKKTDFRYFKEELFNTNKIELNHLQMNYCLFKHVFFWLLDTWSPEDEENDAKFCILLEKMHQTHQLFYHWAWYVFPRILDFYNTPEQKIRFLYKCTNINNTEHVWNDLPDHPARISLGRRPRPIMQLIYRIANTEGQNNDTWKKFYIKIESICEKSPVQINNFWKAFKLELIEARTSSVWEDAGKGFEQEPKIPAIENIKWNMPLHVFMNPPVKFIPYMAKAIWKESGALPNIMFTAMELQCFYCTSKSKTYKVKPSILCKALQPFNTLHRQ